MYIDFFILDYEVFIEYFCVKLVEYGWESDDDFVSF